MLRLERDELIFGLKLSVYEKREDFYGRQYPTHDGRIDILTVDEVGNYHVIELKKDKGYGQVFDQMNRYIKWVKEHKATDNQKVYGIICLKNPDKATVQQIKENEGIRLFEYAITYQEIK